MTLAALLIAVLATVLAVALYKVGIGGGWTTAVAGVTVTQVPLILAVEPDPPATSNVPDLTDTELGLTARLATANLF